MLVYILAFVSAALLVAAAILFYRSGGKNRKEILERIDSIDAAPGEDAEEESLLVKSRSRSLVERILDGSAILAHIETLLRQSNSHLSVDALLLRSLGPAALGFLAGLAFSKSLAISFLAFLLVGLMPYFWLRIKRTRRVRAITKCLPDTMDLVQHSLQAGLSLSEAFKRATEKAKEPLAGEFRRVVLHVERGADLRAELITLSDRVPSADLRMFVTAVLVQRETGGNLPLILSRLSEMVRMRFTLLGEMRSETAQGRLSAYVLSLLPILIFFVIRFIDPKYLTPLLSAPLGRDILWCAGISNVIGLLIMRRMTSLEV